MHHDAPNDANQRFDDAAKLNESVGSPPGPFWGHPPGFVDSRLTWRVSFPFRTARGQTLRELRHTDRRLRSARSGCPSPSGSSAGQASEAAKHSWIPLPPRFETVPGSKHSVASGHWGRIHRRYLLPASGRSLLHAEISPGVPRDRIRTRAPSPNTRQVLHPGQWALPFSSDGRLAAELAPPPDLSDGQITDCVLELDARRPTLQPSHSACCPRTQWAPTIPAVRSGQFGARVLLGDEVG